MSVVKILPYVYKCTHKVTERFYIGSRCKNKTPAELDILTYKTSSKYVKPIFDEFDVEIVAIFFNGVDAYNFEQKLIYEHWKHPLLLNKHCCHGKVRWSLVGTKQSDKTKLKISESKIGREHTENTKEKISLALKGKQWCDSPARKKSRGHSAASKAKMSQTRKDRKYKQTTEITEKLREINTGRRWYTNGEVNIKSRTPIEGFQLGMTAALRNKRIN